MALAGAIFEGSVTEAAACGLSESPRNAAPGTATGLTVTGESRELETASEEPDPTWEAGADVVGTSEPREVEDCERAGAAAA